MIRGCIGRPSIIVSFAVVTFREPLGIGDAVTPAKVLAAAEASEADVALPDEVEVPFAGEVVAAAPLAEKDGLEPEAVERTLVDCGGSEVLVSGGGVEVEAAGAGEVS